MHRFLNMANLCYILYIFLCHFPQFYDTLEASSKTTEVIHELLFEEISTIKKKVWIDISAQIRALSTQIDEKTQGGTLCACPSLETNHSLISNDLMSRESYVKLLNGFRKEKIETRNLERRLKGAFMQISELETELEIYKQETDDLKASLDTSTIGLEKAEHDLKSVQTSLVNLKTASEGLRDDIDIVSKKCLDVHRMDTDFHAPSFISEWMLMRAHDQNLAQRVVHHGLGVLPVKVEVQIRPTTGPNAGWIFHGDAAFQSDDDYGQVYGGIVYFYNETQVILVAPNKNNDQNAGVVVNTGYDNFRRIGNNHQVANEAFVRIKVWTPADFPKPDFETDWLPLDVTNSSLSYYELEHGLPGYPRLINVQIRCHASDYSVVSEGLGATMMHRSWSNEGGAVYAFNNKSVRLWTGYLESLSGNERYRLIGWSDGWGTNPVRGVDIGKGEFRILSWARISPTNYDTEEKVELNTDFPEWSAFEHISPENDLLSFYVEATDGINRGYRFKGYGNSQSIDSPFGGVVYAFNSAGNLRLWRPNATNGGHLIHVHKPYGHGMNVQASDNGQYVSTLIKTSG